MSDNIYEAPQAELVDGNIQQKEYFIVSSKKLWLVNILTMGLYSVVWFYWHWRRIKHHDQSDIMPVWRAIFSVIFAYPLFLRIATEIDMKELAHKFSAGVMATCYIVLALGSYILSFLIDDTNSAHVLLSTVLTVFTAVVSTFILSRAQNIVNDLCGDPQGSENAKFTLLNFVWMLLGLLVWLATFAGTMVLMSDASL